MKFYLGTHRPHWLELTEVPLFVSRRWLAQRKRPPRARGPWALDSGGFTELSTYGEWTLTARQYVREVQRFRDEVGLLDFAAPQDWMCEPGIVRKTGLSVPVHQRLTVANLLDLRALDDTLPIVPVLQGFTLDQYLACVELYERHGVALADEPLVGLGTICRRQNMIEAEAIVRRLAQERITLHGFGVKVTGLDWYGEALASADSMAWSWTARVEALRAPPACGRKACNNCLHYALEWREALLARPPVHHQLPLAVAS